MKTTITDLPLSALIRIAVQDTRQAARSSWYKLAMGSWHTPNDRGEGLRCEVCMAGAVMAYSLGRSRVRRLFPNDFGARTEQALLAVNNARGGDLANALDKLDVNTTPAQNDVLTRASHLIYDEYDHFTGHAPWRTYLRAAKMLEEVGL